MKSIDEVIDALEVCSQMDAECDKCPYHATAKGWCEEKDRDALHYLKEYRNCGDCSYADSYLRCTQDSRNVPLTWDELRQMEGKPVWVEYDGKERWRIIREVSSEHLILESGLPLHRSWMNHPEGWQAYRKERERKDDR